MQKKYFIGGINSFLFSNLVENLRNDFENDENPHIFKGTESCTQDPIKIPNGADSFVNVRFLFTKIFDKSNFAKELVTSDCIIYSIENSFLDEIDLALSSDHYFKTVIEYASQESISDKMFILISKPKIWQSPFFSDDESFEPKEINDTDVELSERNFEGTNFLIKSLEDRVLNLSEMIFGCKGIVICPGLTYGLGEDKLTFLFKKAWLNEDLPLLSISSNIIPTIHINDLCNAISLILESSLEKNYIFLNDDSRNTQKEIVNAVAKQFGAEGFENVQFSACEEFISTLETNISMKRSNLEIFDSMNWQYKEGFVDNIEKISQEFMKYRGLLTTRICVLGAPATGKSSVSKRLSEIYNLPLISTKEVLDEVISLQNEIGEEFRKALEDVKTKMIEEAMLEFEKKKKKAKKDVAADMVFDSSHIIPRVPIELIPKAFAYRMSKSDCSCRGFILEGFPKSFEDARLLFECVKTANEENIAEDKVQRPLFFPQHIVFLEGTDEMLLSRAKGKLPEEENEEEKAEYLMREERINRRLPIFKKLITDSNSSIHYLEAQKVEFLRLDVSEKDIEDIVVAVKEYLSRIDSPVTLINETDEYLRWRNTKTAMQSFREEEARKTRILEDKEAEENIQRTIAEEEEKEKLAKIIEAEKELLDIRSQPLRQYLVDNLIPHLMNGLIEVCKIMPEDPIQMLIDHLEKAADDIMDANESQ